MGRKMLVVVVGKMENIDPQGKSILFLLFNFLQLFYLFFYFKGEVGPDPLKNIETEMVQKDVEAVLILT